MKSLNNKLTRHHIIPKSRGGAGDPYNITLVTEREHEYYHALFGNRTPDEIKTYLRRTFWTPTERWQ